MFVAKAGIFPFIAFPFVVAEPQESLFQQGHLPAGDLAKIHLADVKAGDILKIRFFQNAFLAELVKVNQQGVSGESRITLVGAVAVGHGTQGEDLPQLLACLPEEVDPGKGVFAHGAYAFTSRQGGDVKENAAVSFDHFRRICLYFSR